MASDEGVANGTNGARAINGNGVDTPTCQPAVQLHKEMNGATTNGSGDGTVETDFLIVGCGPAGASLACFLGSYGKLSSRFLTLR